MNRFAIVAIVAIGLASGCAQPLHLGYDHGRAFTDCFTMQPDLMRESVVDAAYPLAGVEAAKIRLNVEAATTNAESGEGVLEM